MNRISLDPLPSQPLNHVSAAAFQDEVFARALATLWRRRWFVVTTTAICLALGLAYLAIAPRQYTAEALIQLDLGLRASVAGDPSAPSVPLEAANIINGEVKIIESRMIARRVVQRLHLEEPTPVPPQPATSPPPWLKQWLDVHRLPALARLYDVILAKPVVLDGTESAMRKLMSHLTVRSDNRNYLITIAYQAENARYAAKVANTFATEYQQFRIDENTKAATANAQWLTGEIKAARETLQDLEGRIAAFREQSGLVSDQPDGEGLPQDLLRATIAQLSSVKLEALRAQAQFGRLRRAAETGQAPASDDLGNSPWVGQLVERDAADRSSLTELLARFGPNHPAVIAARARLAQTDASLRQEETRAARLAGQEVGADIAAMHDLQQQVDQLQQRVIASRAKQDELQHLEAQAQVSRDWIKALMVRYDQVTAERDRQTISAMVAVPAEPVPSSSLPQPSIVFGLALLCGLLSGVGGTAFTERLDRGFRTGREVEAVTGARCMGAVPTPRIAQWRAKAFRRPAEAFEEPVLTVCAELGLFDKRHECRMLAVTSSLPWEGKSALCQALAEVAARSGQRILLLAGHAERVSQDRAIAAADTTPPVPALRGPRLPIVVRRPVPDVLRFHLFDQFIETARKEYDLIIVETPPVLMFGAALVLGRRADLVLLVATWASTRRKIVSAAVNRLRDNDIVIDGVVLTQVDPLRYARFQTLDECFFFVKRRRAYARALHRCSAAVASHEQPEIAHEQQEMVS